jgi:hypothetical protein
VPTRYILRGCPRCGGDLWFDDPDWSCLCCGWHGWGNTRRVARATRLLCPYCGCSVPFLFAGLCSVCGHLTGTATTD